MKTRLHANFLYAQLDEELDLLLIGFADDEFETQDYILLQKTLHPSKEDIEDGFDEVFITHCDETQSAYGGILKFYFSSNRAEITLDEEVARQLNSRPVMTIHFHQDEATIAKLHNYLLQLFSEQQGLYHFDG